MIKVNKGKVEVEGIKIDLMAEFTTIVNLLVSKGTFTKEDVEMCIEIAYKSDEEINKEIERAVIDFLLS